jgi:hypothetical protein
MQGGKMNSHQIKKALSERHTKDYFMTEALCGPAGSQRFDAYAITKSWMNLKYTGYEIKVSRGDFLQDEKWRGYLPFCNEFWWVCPKDLIKKEEIPEGCGLIYVYPETMAMRKIIRPKFRKIEHPVEILLYIVFWKKSSNPYPFFNSKAEFFKAWLENKENNRNLGYNVSKALQKEFEKLRNVDDKNKRLEKDLESFEKLKNMLRQEGVRFYGDLEMLSEVSKRLKTTVPNDILQNLKNIQQSSSQIISKLTAGEE